MLVNDCNIYVNILFFLYLIYLVVHWTGRHTESLIVKVKILPNIESKESLPVIKCL